MSKKLYGLIDCNNFYASCERVFAPHLNGKAVVVLSNNDGCVIARSQEAKDLGIEMGVAYFEIEAFVKLHGVEVFSSNFALYGDMSRRVMSVIAGMVEEIEVYSVDEAFVSLPEGVDVEVFGRELRDRVSRWTGIPVSVGIASSKTLAKVASVQAKKGGGIFYINEKNRTEVLKGIEVGKIWGIGGAYAAKFRRIGVVDAWRLSELKDAWLFRHFPIPVLRTVYELRGISCLSLEVEPEERKSICCSRSFKEDLTQLVDLEEALLSFTARATEKMRGWKLFCRSLSIFIQTSPFGSRPSYSNSGVVNLPVASADTGELNSYVVKVLQAIYREGYHYKKAGVVLLDLVEERGVQANFFDELSGEREKRMTLMKSIDKLNTIFGRDTLRMLGSGLGRSWATKRVLLSGRYTTCWGELMSVS